MKTVRIFVSSPGDVGRERDVAAKVVNRLRAQFSARLSIEPYFWEHEPMHAGADFQGQIPPAAQFHIFVGILWSRLGTRLSRSYSRPDGTLYRSGTEYEFETALEAYRNSGQKAPRILIYRRKEIPSFPAEPLQLRQDRERQWEALKSFIDGWFKDATDGGTFRAAYNSYENTADFEQRLELHLQKLMGEFLGEDPQEAVATAAATWTGESPYRGLKAFEFEHAPVFFGRTRSIDQVIGQLSDRDREDKCPFVLIFGSSGSGKSSLLRAGVLPTIVNGAVDGIGLWRRALMQPSRSRGDLFDGLAGALVESNAVPELLTGGLSVESLSEMLRVNTKSVGLLLRGALPQIAQRAHEDEKRQLQELANASRAQRRVADAEYAERLIHELRYPEPRLILALDQLEEIFTNEKQFSAENRKAFLESICSLLESRFVWVLATLRSDFFVRCEELPELVRLKTGKGQFHLLPPDPVELAQMIRLPAQAAGISFEEHPTLGRLEDTLRDAFMADRTSLPLLEFALEALFELGHRNRILRHSDYQKLGGTSGSEGLRGVLVTIAEKVYESLSPAARGVFPDVFLGLATTDSMMNTANGATEISFTRRLVKQTEVLDPAREEVYETFIRARLLVADADAGGQRVVTVAHEALLNAWPRLRQLLESEVSYLRMRSRVSSAAMQWSEENRKPERLAAGVTLAESKEVVAREAQLDVTERDFIRLSVRKSRRRLFQFLAGGTTLILIFAALAVIALLNAREAVRRKQETKRVLALSDLSRAQELLDQNDADTGLVYLSRAVSSDTEIARPAAERLWFALTQRSWPLPTSAIMAHEDAILSLALSPDGTKILTASKDRSAMLSATDSGARLGPPIRFPSYVRTVAFSLDGRWIYTGCFDGTGTLWHLNNDLPVKAWTKSHPNEVTAAVFSPSGDKVITGCRDGVTRAWSALDGNLLTELPGNENVHSILFQPGSDNDVVILSGRTARLWRISEHRVLFEFKHEGEINSAAFTRDGTLIATAGDKPFLQIWRTADGAPVGPPLPHKREVTEVQFGREVLATVADGRAFVWTSDGRQLFQGPLNTLAPVSKLRFSPDGLRIFTGTDDGQVQTWNALTGSAIGEPVREREPIISLTACPDNLHAVVATAENTVRSWLMPTLRPLGFELHHPRAVESMVISRDGRQLATICADGKARVWNAQKGNPTISTLGHPGTAVSVAMSGDGKYIATGGADATLRLWDAVSGAALAEPAKFDTTLAQLSFNPSGSNLLVASQSGLVRIYTVPELRQVSENTAHRTGICLTGFASDGTAVVVGVDGKVEVEQSPAGWKSITTEADQRLTAAAMSRDGQFIATASGGNGQIWNAHTGKKVGEPFQHKAAITALCFSADNRYLVSASDDHTAVIWSVKSGRPAFAALRHASPVSAVAIGEDSARLATGAEDGAVRLWDLATGQALSETLRQAGPIRSLVFADQYSLLSASSDGSVMIWDIRSDLKSADYPELATFARALASSNLTDSGRLSWKPPSTIDQLRQLSGHGPGMKTFSDWFFGDRTMRHLTPFSRWTVADYVANLLQSNIPNARPISDLIMAGKQDDMSSSNQPNYP